ncbi:hypothetical protein P1P75_08315 [Streptomyces sp. ID05-39B]|uniref:hypothetical protein n=1 Tax=Streptomyces TaxID=1883 RepID=UPI0029BB4568|nr:hypothetical protein [Streptomyces sp. ID05-39B]MDX3526444.1 hypothetical protein [Streptomyces sp. ID05-39B]
MDREKHVCPVCGQTVDTVVQRHKTLGAWVPRWVAGPCHNPDCEAYVEPGGEQHGHTERSRDTEHPEQHGRAESPEHADERGTPAPPAS